MEFQLFGEIVAIAPARESYNRYRLMFCQEANQAVQRFKELYRANTSLEMVVNNAPKQMYQSAVPAIRHCVQILIDHNVLTIDEERFTNLYAEVWSAASDAHLKIQDQYAEIVLKEADKDAYRTARREGRGRWQGGGFGFEGAIKGAATAGILNMFTGAGHMLFNGMAKFGSSIAANSKMDKIFKSNSTLKTLADGLYQTVYMFHLALIDCLHQTGADNLTLEGIVSPKDSETVAALLRNIPQITDQNQRRAAMIRAFEADPYQEDWYRAALRYFGDPDGSLETVERYFGISVIRTEKERQLNQFVQSLPLDTEAQAQLAAKKIEEAKANLCYSGETEQTQSVLAAVERFDCEYRTVDGITLPTREDADAARKELSAILRVEEGINGNDLSSISEAEEKIRGYSSPVAKAHQEKLHQQWVSLDKQMRSVSTLLPNNKKISCKTIEQAEQLRPIVQELKQRLDGCGEGAPAESSLAQMKTDLAAMLVPSALRDCYVDEIDNRLAAIDTELRTTLGKEYATREDAREAERQYHQIRADFTTGNPRKNGAKFRERIESIDVTDEIREELLGELFQLENAREIKVAKTFSTVSGIILVTIIVASYIFHLSGTDEFARKDVIVKGVSLMITDIQQTDELSFLDGLKNGLVVFGRSFGDIFVNGFFEYTGGFTYGLLGNVLWAFWGLFWVFIKQVLLGIARYFVSLVVTIIQTAPIRYYIGYVIGAAIPLAVSQLSFDEDKQEENVKRIKGWSIKKICLTILVILAVVAVTIYFVQREL